MGAAVKSIIQAGLEPAYAQGGALPGAVAAKKIWPNTEAKFNLDKTFDEPDERRGSYDKYFKNIQGLTRHTAWSWKGEYYPDTMVSLWAMAISDTPTIALTGAGAHDPAYYTWTFSPADGTQNLRGMTFEEFDGTASWQYPNCFAEKLDLDFTAEKALEVTLSGMGLDKVTMGSGVTGALSQPSELPHIGPSAQVWLDPAGPTHTPGTTPYADLTGAKIGWELSTKSIWTAQNAGTFSRWYRGKRLVTADLDIDFTTTAEYNHFASSDFRLFQLTFNGPLLPGGDSQATKNYQLTVILPLHYKTWEIDKGKENVTAKIKGFNYYDPDLAYSHQVICRVSSGTSGLSNF